MGRGGSMRDGGGYSVNVGVSGQLNEPGREGGLSGRIKHACDRGSGKRDVAIGRERQDRVTGGRRW